MKTYKLTKFVRIHVIAFLSLLERLLPVTTTVAVVLLCEGLLGCVGCNQNPRNFTGSVTVSKVNGTVTAVEVEFPEGGHHIEVYNRKDAQALTMQLESMLTELKIAADQFRVDEVREMKKEQKKE